MTYTATISLGSCLKLIAGFIVIASLPTLIMLHKRALRMRNEADLDFDELMSKYKKWESHIAYTLLCFSFLLAFIFTLVLSLAVSAIHSSEKQWEYVFSTSWHIWLIHGLFVGIIISVVPTHFLFKHLLGAKRYDELNLYLRLKNGTDGKRLLVVIAILTIGVNCITLPLFIDCYVKIGGDKIVIDRVYGLEETVYSFQNIEKIVLVKSQKSKKGMVSRRQYHEIHFEDGYVFSFDKSVYEPSWSEEIQAMNFIAEKRGDVVLVVDPYPKVGELR